MDISQAALLHLIDLAKGPRIHFEAAMKVWLVNAKETTDIPSDTMNFFLSNAGGYYDLLGYIREGEPEDRQTLIYSVVMVNYMQQIVENHPRKK